MKKLWISAALLAALLAGALYSTQLLSARVQTLTALLEGAAARAEARDFQAARRITQEALDQWDGWSAYLSIVAHHAEAEKVTEQFSLVAAYLEFPEEAAAYFAANAVLIERIQTVYETERLTLANLL